MIGEYLSNVSRSIKPLKVEGEQPVESMLSQIPWRIVPERLIVVIGMETDTLHAIRTHFGWTVDAHSTSAPRGREQVKFLPAMPAFHRITRPCCQSLDHDFLSSFRYVKKSGLVTLYLDGSLLLQKRCNHL